MKYLGGKNLNGFYQKIINLIPKHSVYIETHLGSGAIMRYKRPARINYGIEINKQVLNNFKGNFNPKNINLICSDSLEFLKNFNFTGDEFIYCDPPYLKATRKSNRNIYKYEYSNKQHIELLEILTRLPCNIMISGYYSDLYNVYLKNWHAYNFDVKTRSGAWAKEYLWMNYKRPTKLHDYSYVGNDFRERERIKRKVSRWTNRLQSMPELERNAILTSVIKKFSLIKYSNF